MTISGNQLLSALGSGILPGGAARPETPPSSGARFEEVLARIERGDPSKIGIQLGKGVLNDQVSVEMREKVGRAADLAAVKGIKQAAVNLGDSFVRLDVSNRVLEAQFKPSGDQVIERIDGFVSLGSQEDESPGANATNPAPASVPARVVRNASLAALLASGEP